MQRGLLLSSFWGFNGTGVDIPCAIVRNCTEWHMVRLAMQPNDLQWCPPTRLDIRMILIEFLFGNFYARQAALSCAVRHHVSDLSAFRTGKNLPKQVRHCYSSSSVTVCVWSGNEQIRDKPPGKRVHSTSRQGVFSTFRHSQRRRQVFERPSAINSNTNLLTQHASFVVIAAIIDYYTLNSRYLPK